MIKTFLGSAKGVLAAGLIGTAMLGFTVTGTFSAFTAQITNSINTVKAGTLILQEQNSDNSITCLSTDANAANAAICATINKYGGATLLPGQSSTTTVKMKNNGTATPNTFTLTPGACTQSGTPIAGITAAVDLCAKMTIKVYAAATATGTPIATGTATAIASNPVVLVALAPGATQDYTFVATLDATAGNTYQNLTGSQPLVWAMS